MRKGVILMVVIGVMMLVLVWVLVSLYFMTQESRIAGHKIRRTRAFFAAKAGIIHALEELRKGNNPDGETLQIGDPATTITITVGAPIVDGSALDGTRPISVRAEY